MLTYPEWLPRQTVQNVADAILNVYRTDWGDLSHFKSEAFMFGAQPLWGSKTNFGCITEIDGVEVVACRGTNTLEEWVTDAAINGKVPFKDWGHVHSGFYEIFESVWIEIGSMLLGYKSVIFTGHSLGAAVATLMASELHIKNSDTNISVVTFGSPKVGDTRFVSTFNASKINSCRIFNTLDLIPKLPFSLHLPEILIPNYAQVDEELSFTGNHEGLIEAHQMVNYISVL